MFDYVTKSDAERRQNFAVQLGGGVAVALVLAGTLSLLTGRTGLGLSSLFLGIWEGATALNTRKTQR